VFQGNYRAGCWHLLRRSLLWCFGVGWVKDDIPSLTTARQEGFIVSIGQTRVLLAGSAKHHISGILKESVLIGYETCRRQDPQCHSQSQRWTAVSSFISVNDTAKHLWHIRHINICCSVAAIHLSDINLIISLILILPLCLGSVLALFLSHLALHHVTISSSGPPLAQGQLAQGITRSTGSGSGHQANCSTIT